MGPKIGGGTLFWGPYNMDPTIYLGYYIKVPISLLIYGVSIYQEALWLNPKRGNEGHLRAPLEGFKESACLSCGFGFSGF